MEGQNWGFCESDIHLLYSQLKLCSEALETRQKGILVEITYWKLPVFFSEIWDLDKVKSVQLMREIYRQQYL